MAGYTPSPSSVTTAPTGPNRLGQDTVLHLLLAALLTIALYFVPYAGFVTYPLRLLVTFIHEGSHALMAVLTGGVVRSIAINPDASGLTMTMGGVNPLISSAGYLGATLYGTLLIAALRRGVSGRVLLCVTAGAVALVTLGGVGALSPFTILWGVLLAGGLFLAARKLPPHAASWLAGFVGVQCVLNAFFDLRTLFDLSLMSGTQTDAQNMAQMTLIPAVVWSVIWIATAVAMLVLVLAPAFGAKVRIALPRRRSAARIAR